MFAENGHRVTDEEGLEFQSLEKALQEAEASLREFIREQAEEGRSPRKLKIVVSDKAGKTLRTVTAAALLH